MATKSTKKPVKKTKEQKEEIARKKMVKKWITALRSGKYEQGKEALRVDTTDRSGEEKSFFCCLGVLCDVKDPKGWTGGTHNYSHPIDREAYISKELLDLVGLTHSEQETLATFNDSGYVFERVANEISKMTGVKV